MGREGEIKLEQEDLDDACIVPIENPVSSILKVFVRDDFVFIHNPFKLIESML